MLDERAAMDQVGRYWDAFVSGEPAATIALEPDLAKTIQRLQHIKMEPPGGARDRVRKEVLANVHYAQPRQEPPMLHVVAPESLHFPPATGSARGGDAYPRQPRWVLAQLATAALVVLTLVGSFFAFGPGRRGGQEGLPAIIPAIGGTPATPDAVEAPVAELLWSTRGDPDRPLLAPGYLALDPAGNLWVPDGGNDRFQIFAPDGTFLESWGESGSGNGQFEFELELNASAAIAFAPNGSFYIVDSGNRRIQKFGPDRTFVASWGGEGIAPGQFKAPNGIAVDSQGRVYVSDDGRDDVQVFDEQQANLQNGIHLRTIGERGFNDGQFIFASGSAVAIDPAGNALISDTTNHRIQTFTPDGELVAVLRGGPREDELGLPNQVAVDAAGQIFVTAPDRRQVQVFAADGSYLAAWGTEDAAAWADPNLGADAFLAPVGIVLDGQGHVYVSDYERETVQKFRLLEPLAVQSSAEDLAPDTASTSVAEFVWKTSGDPDLPLTDPFYLTIAPDGNLWAPDGLNGRFQIFAPDGTFLEAWGIAGSGEGQINLVSAPYGVGAAAFDAAGNLYVADYGNGRIQKFGPDRSFLQEWGGAGSEDERILEPIDIAVDEGGNVYVSDAEAKRVRVFTSDGQFLTEWGGLGSGEGQFLENVGLAIDGEGNVLVADAGAHRIQRFAPDGTFLASWGEYGSGPLQFRDPNDIAVDVEGRIYVTDWENHRVQVLDSDGRFLAAWGSVGDGDGQFAGPTGIALDELGNVYVSDDGADRVQKFRLLAPLPAAVAAKTPTEVAENTIAEFVWQSEGDPELPLADPVRTAFDPQGNIWVTDGGNSRFQVFSPDGVFLEAWGMPGSAAGRFDFVDPLMFGGYGGGAMAFDDAGNLYVADPGNHRIQKFAPDRVFITTWGSKGEGDGQFLEITDLVIDGQGRVFVTDEGRDDVQVFDANGQFLTVWDDAATGWLPQPSGITIDAEGNLWIAHFNSNRIQKYTPDGELLATIGEYGSSPGQLRNPSDVALDGRGRVYVADWGSSRVQVFDAEGQVLAVWGELGLDAGQLMGPNSALPDGAGNVYVAEDGNDRLQKFRLLLPTAPPSGSLADVDSEEKAPVAALLWETNGPPEQTLDHPGLMAIDAGGNLWIPNIGADQIQIVSPDGEFIEAWGTPGTGEGQFDFSWEEKQISGGAVAFDGAGNIYVAEKGNRRIQKFAPDRSFLLSWGGEGTGEGQFIAPDSIAINREGRVYVADGERDDIQVFDGDGNYLSTFGGFGVGDGQFYFFCGSSIAFAANRDLLVSEACNQRVQRFSPEGVFLATIGGVGAGEGRMNQPQQIAVDAAGRIFVAEYSNHRVQVFTSDGTFLAQWGQEGLGPTYGPFGLALNGQGTVFVTDIDEDRLLAFQLLPPLAPG